MLTPSHLPLGRRLLSTFEELFDEEGRSDNTIITRRMKYLKALTEHYWRRFREEYLLELRSQHVQGGDPERKPEVGEVVVIEGTSKRNNWRLGKIVSLINGRDNRCRGAVIKTFDGVKGRYMQRPIKRLYPIEVKSTVPISTEEISTEEINDSNATTSSSTNDISDSVVKRPRRVAADNGVLIRRFAGYVWIISFSQNARGECVVNTSCTYDGASVATEI